MLTTRWLGFTVAILAAIAMAVTLIARPHVGGPGNNNLSGTNGRDVIHGFGGPGGVPPGGDGDRGLGRSRDRRTAKRASVRGGGAVEQTSDTRPRHQ
jgi:hypothetical protein